VIASYVSEQNARIAAISDVSDAIETLGKRIREMLREGASPATVRDRAARMMLLSCELVDLMDEVRRWQDSIRLAIDVVDRARGITAFADDDQGKTADAARATDDGSGAYPDPN
jgi:hypothetical protein